MNSIAIQPMSSRTSLLRRALLADVVVTGGAGLLLTTLAGPLSDPLGLPAPLLRSVGVFLLPYSGAVLSVATRSPIPRAGARTIIALNLLWAVTSLALLISGWIAPSALGVVFVIMQALLVVAFAGAQYIGLRRTDG